MRWLWTISAVIAAPASRDKRRRCFLFLNSLLAGLAGLVLWLVVRVFALDSFDWLLCFVGYPVMLHGVLGGSVYLLHVDDDSEE